MKEIKGCGTALITPFTKGGEIDLENFTKLVERQLEGGVDFLVPLGTTAETPTLEDYEKELLLDRLQQINRGRVPIIIGVGTNSTKGVISNIKKFEKYGANALLVVVPYYNKPTQQGIYEHYKAISESTSTPIVLYNVPSRTGINMSAETTLRLAQLNNIVATKEASSNYAQISEIIGNAPQRFSVISGNDDETFPLMTTGAKGVISVAANVAPKPIVRLVGYLQEGKVAEAALLHHKLMPLFKGCFIESNPIPSKAAIASMGLIENILRLPLTSSTPQTEQLMKKILEQLRVDKLI
ncbi:MAG: 4-hydroxy-tetrahydrodipicolinate synthase [Bacteroidales bacterium]